MRELEIRKSWDRYWGREFKRMGEALKKSFEASLGGDDKGARKHVVLKGSKRMV